MTVFSSLAAGSRLFERAESRVKSAQRGIYNLLFCDNLELLRPKSGAPTGELAVLLARTPQVDELRRLAENEAGESRVRAVAYQRLRAANADVAKGALLGVIIEVPQPQGLDVLAVFADGRMRYINQSGKLAVFENTPAAMVSAQKALLRASAAAIKQIGPWDKARLPPPKRGAVRLSFSSPAASISKDEIGGPVLSSATALLLAIVDASAKPAGTPPSGPPPPRR